MRLLPLCIAFFQFSVAGMASDWVDDEDDFSGIARLKATKSELIMLEIQRTQLAEEVMKLKAEKKRKRTGLSCGLNVHLLEASVKAKRAELLSLQKNQKLPAQAGTGSKTNAKKFGGTTGSRQDGNTGTNKVSEVSRSDNDSMRAKCSFCNNPKMLHELEMQRAGLEQILERCP